MSNFYMTSLNTELNKELNKEVNNILNSISSNDPKSIQETLKNNILKFNTPENIVSPVEKGVSLSKWYMFKIGLAIIIISFLLFNVYTYVTSGNDGITYLFGDFFGKTTTDTPDNASVKAGGKAPEKASKNTVRADKSPSAVYNSIDKEAVKLSKSEKKKDSELEETIEKNVNSTNKKSYSANNISNNISKKSGFCYVGSDRNVRTCVQVGKEDTCMSGEVYPSMDICINPSLKE